MLEEFINSEEFELDDGMENSTSANKNTRKATLVAGEEFCVNRYEDEEQDQQDGETKRKKMVEEEKLRKRNTAQIIRDKILTKIKFIISIDDSRLNEFKLNYSILL